MSFYAENKRPFLCGVFIFYQSLFSGIFCFAVCRKQTDVFKKGEVMKHIWIHTLGYILTVVGAFWNQTSDAAYDVYNGALYTRHGSTSTISGYASYNNSWADNYINKYGCNYTDRYNVISECGGNSYCNGTGVYCTSSGFFSGCVFDSSGSMFPTGTGCIYRPAYWAGASTYAYTFVGCDSGWYRSPSGTGISACSPGVSGYTSYTVFANCCARCSSYVGTPETGITNTGNDYWSSNCSSGWCWRSDTGIGISTCKIYPDPSGKSYSDTVGTYTLPNGCPYIQ